MNKFWARLGSPLAFVLIGAGLVALYVGYNGAASDPRPGAQLPYVVSGIGLGLGLMIVGSALLIARSAREDAAVLASRLTELMTLAPAAPSAVSNAPMNTAGLVAVGNSSYHLTTCRLVEGRLDQLLTAAEAQAQGLSACRVCKPELAIAR